MDRFENHCSNKRNTKLDSFLRRNMESFHCGYIRYYEKCVIELRGAFLHSHLVLTDEHLYITQNPPKSLTYSIPLSQIRDVRLVPERHSVIAGGTLNVFTSQHVHILSNKETPEIKKTSFIKMDSGMKHFGKTQRTQENFNLPLSIRLAYSPIPIGTTYNSITTKNILENSQGTTSYEKIPKLMQRRNVEEDTQSNSSDSSKSIDLSTESKGSFDSEVVDPVIHHRASSVLEQDLSSWRVNNENELIEAELENRRPSSVDLGQLPQRRRLLGKYFRTRKLLKEETKVALEGKPSDSISEFEEIHLHLYEANSVFLNELFLYWNRQILKYTLRIDQMLPVSQPLINTPTAIHGKLDRIIMNVIEKTATMTYSDTRLMRTQKARLQTFLVFRDLYEDLLTHPLLQRLCFQKSALITAFLDILMMGIKKSERVSEEREDEKYLEDVLSIELILMDIFRLLIEANTGTGFYSKKEKDISFDRNGCVNCTSTMKTLVKIISTPSNLSLGKDVDIVLADPQRFAKLNWVNDPHITIISLAVMRHNVSTTLLYEILSLCLYTYSDHHYLSTFLKDFDTAQFLNQGVTQIFNLVWPSRPMMTPSQCVLFYQHVTVLRTLMNNLSAVTNYLRTNFCEEFKYFISSHSLESKIPEEYPIKAKTVGVFESIRSEILSLP